MNAQLLRTLPIWLSAHGFDPVRMGFAGRTAVAACIAFVLSWMIGLEHPQWAAMTVWAASQPTRGQLWEKSAFRVLGSISGTAIGIGLVLAMQIHPALLVIGLALWVSACTYIGNLQRGFTAYGTVLAGYTAAMVSLLDAAHPEHVMALGADRLATVLSGVVVATLIGSLFSPKAVPGQLRQKVVDLLIEMFDLAATTEPQAGKQRALLSDLAAIEEGLDPHGAGSLRSRQSIRVTRALLIAATPLILWKHGDRQPAAFRAELTQVAKALKSGDFAAARAALIRATRIEGVSPRFLETLHGLDQALLRWQDQPSEPSRVTAAPLRLHRDWVGAREAGLRALGALLLFGGIWLATGWAVGAFMLLGLSVMISLFSTFENPAQMMRSVFFGQFLGVTGAILLRWQVWPLAESELQMILLTLPFILIGPLFVGHNKTVAMSFDYNMVLMLMSQPHWPLTGSFGGSVAAGLAVISAPLAALIAYLTVYPVSLKRRVDTVLQAMLHDLRDLASDPKALEVRPHWRARLYHRTLRLVRLSERAGRAQEEALDAGLAVLNLGQVAMWCHRIAQDTTQNVSDRRAARTALLRLSQIELKPGRARDALTGLSRRREGPEAALFLDAVAGIDALAPSLEKG